MPEQRRSSSRTGSTPKDALKSHRDGTREAEPAAEAAEQAGPVTVRRRWREFVRRRPVVAWAGVATLLGAVALAAFQLGAPRLPEGDAIVEIPQGATFRDVVGILEAGQVIGQPLLFTAQARLRGLDRSVKAGTYRIRRGAPHRHVLELLAQGRVVTHPMTIPEGWTLDAMAARIAAVAGTDSASVAAMMRGQSHARWELPGPGLEGYLFPDTYRFAEGVADDRVVAAMIDGYRRYWTPDRRARLAASGLTERELVTLASIVQAEAGRQDEMPTIASVYHNRLRIGMPLQADPTVLYALTDSLGGHRTRLLYAAIDSVADHRYNTYTHSGLPPGPIGAPGAAALDAALAPDSTAFLYFVAAGDGRHIFSRTLREHNNARNRIRRR